MHLVEVPQWFNILLEATVVVSVAWRGRTPERVLAATIILSSLLARLVCQGAACWEGDYPPKVVVWLVSDIVSLSACLWFLRRTKHYWLIWAASISLASLITDGSALFAPIVSLWSYASAALIWAYALEGLLLWAVWGPKPAPQASSSMSQ